MSTEGRVQYRRLAPLMAAAAALVGCETGAGPDSPGLGPPGAPAFSSFPETRADHNRPWTYTIQASDPDGDPVELRIDQRPDWLAYDAAVPRLSGIAGWDNVGLHGVRIVASDGQNETSQNFSILVVKGEIICNQPFGDATESEYVLPFQANRTYRNIQSYCPPNPAWGHHDWFAYDFDTAIGDTIIASRAGTVLFVRENFTDGNRVCGEENFVFIRHVDGTVMQYVHLTRNGALVVPGEVVEQGQAIGISGDTGCSSGPHLHVNLFRDQTDFSRQASLPVNYRNAEGPLDANDGLVFQAAYTALPF